MSDIKFLSKLKLDGIKFRRLTYFDLARVKWLNELCLPENYSWRTWLGLYNLFSDISFVAIDTKKDLACAYCVNKMDEGPSFWNKNKIVKKGHVFSVATHPDYRKRGLATILLALSFDAMFKKGAEEIFLEVRVSNTPAITLYQKRFKMEIVGRVVGYYHDGEDCYVMAVPRIRVENLIREIVRYVKDKNLLEYE